MDDEVKSILAYIERIQNYEKRGFRNFTALISVVWGFLLFFAGVMDYYTYIVNDPLFHFLPWLIASGEGILFTLIIRKGIQRAFFDETVDQQTAELREKVGKHIAKTTTLLILIIWVGVFALLWFNLFFLIIPYVTLVVGLIMLLDTRFGHSSVVLKRGRYWNAGVVLIASLSIFVLYLATGIRFVQYYGIFGGTVIGISFVGFGWYYSLYNE